AEALSLALGLFRALLLHAFLLRLRRASRAAWVWPRRVFRRGIETARDEHLGRVAVELVRAPRRAARRREQCRARLLRRLEQRRVLEQPRVEHVGEAQRLIVVDGPARAEVVLHAALHERLRDR